MTRRKTVGSVLCGIMLIFASVALSQTSVQQIANAAEETDADTVMNVQDALNAAGYDCGTADGVAGSQTVAAIQQYQEENGLTASGEIDEALLISLGLSGITMNGVTGDTEFEISDSKLTLTGYEIGSDYNGNDTLILYCNYTNNGSTGKNAFSDFYFQVYQNGISRDQTFAEYQSGWYEANNNAWTNIKDGASLDVAVGYQLENTSDTVEIEVQEYVTFNDTWSFSIDFAQSGNDNPSGETVEVESDVETDEEPETEAESETEEGGAVVYAPSTDLTGTVAEATMNTILIQTDDGSTYLCATEDTEFDLTSGGITLGMEVEVTLASDTSDEYGLFTAETVTEIGAEEETETEENRTVTAPSTELTGTIVEGAMNTITVQTEDGSTYLIARDGAEFNLTSGGITLGMEVEVTLASDTSDEYGLFTAETITEIGAEEETQTEENNTVIAPSTDLTGTIAEATMNTILLQTDDGSEYLIATEDTEFNLTDGLTLGLEVEVTLTNDTSDEYGLFTAETVTEIGGEEEAETEEDRTVTAPSTELTGTIAEATMNTILVQTDDGSTYLCATEDTEFDLTSGGITLGMEVEVTLESDVSDEYGLFTADTVTEIGTEEETEELEKIDLVTGPGPVILPDEEEDGDAETEEEAYDEEFEDSDETPEDTDSDRYIKHINNYVGKNAATIGYLSLGGDIRDRYGTANIEISFISEDGTYLDPENSEQLQEYVVTGQMPEAGSELRVTYQTDDEGNEYDYLTDDLSYDEILLVVKPIEDTGIDYQADISLTEISPSPDKYTKYIADFVGRNLASCGYVSLGGQLRAENGHANYILNIITEDGTYIDPEDRQTQKQYIVTGQYPDPNTENDLVFSTDSDGNEYSNLIHSQTVESVDIYVTKLPDEIIASIPMPLSAEEE